MLRKAPTEILYTVATIYNMVNKSDVYVMERPIIDGYVSLKSFDEAAREGSIADVPYMIGYTLNDMGSMSPGIAEFVRFVRVRVQRPGLMSLHVLCLMMAHILK